MDGLVPYIAGFFDADGSISAHRNNWKRRPGKDGQWTVEVVVVNTCIDVLIIYQNRYGGSVRRRKKEEKWTQCFAWRCPQISVRNALGDMLPYLVVKKRQAELGIEMRKLIEENAPNRGYHRSLPQENLNKRLEIAKEMSELKKMASRIVF